MHKCTHDPYRYSSSYSSSYSILQAGGSTGRPAVKLGCTNFQVDQLMAEVRHANCCLVWLLAPEYILTSQRGVEDCYSMCTSTATSTTKILQ